MFTSEHQQVSHHTVTHDAGHVAHHTHSGSHINSGSYAIAIQNRRLAAKQAHQHHHHQ